MGNALSKPATGAFIIVCPLDSLPDVLSQHRRARLVTFASPGNTPSEIISGNVISDHLALEFNDIPAPRDGYLAPTAAHVEQLISFVQDWRSDVPLVLNCWMGISRSTAAAAIALAKLRPDLTGTHIGKALREAGPSATPNPLMIAHADGLLDRGGTLIRGIKAIGRGAVAHSGSVFSLDPTAIGALRPHG
ncbi:MAG: tyrosine protein phosphatase [Pseudomonadota bacterium]